MSGAPHHIPEGPIRLTYEDYRTLPEDGRRYEILDGELHGTPSPTTRHQAVSRNLLWILESHVRPRRLGSLFCPPIDVVLADTTVVQPDLLFVRAGREAVITERAIEGAPDLTVEIVSRTSSRRDRVLEAELYARHGVREYWIVDPEERRFEIYVLDRGSYRLVAEHVREGIATSDLLPELEIDLAAVWAS